MCERCVEIGSAKCEGHKGFTPCIGCMGVKHGCKTNGLGSEQYVAQFVDGIELHYLEGEDFLPDNQGLTRAARAAIGLPPLEKRPRRRKTGNKRSTFYVNNSNI
jgi:hypothetical protein